MKRISLSFGQPVSLFLKHYDFVVILIIAALTLYAGAASIRILSHWWPFSDTEAVMLVERRIIQVFLVGSVIRLLFTTSHLKPLNYLLLGILFGATALFLGIKVLIWVGLY